MPTGPDLMKNTYMKTDPVLLLIIRSERAIQNVLWFFIKVRVVKLLSLLLLPFLYGTHICTLGKVSTCFREIQKEEKEIQLTRSIRDSESSIDFVQGPPGSHRERVKTKEYSVGHFRTNSTLLFQVVGF